MHIDVLNPSWMIFSQGFRRDPLRLFSSRALDVLASLAVLVVALPAMVLTFLAIKIDDGWHAPALYRQERVGLGGQPFRVLKFRSMRQDAELNGAQWAQHADPRVTRVGAIIRKLRIDELPQVFNVLRGHMSFVGPRPERPEFVAQLAEKIPYYVQRHCVKPGITGFDLFEVRRGVVVARRVVLVKPIVLVALESPLNQLVVEFIGGGALAIEMSRVRSFFPSIYNEDWFFLLDGNSFVAVDAEGRVCQLSLPTLEVCSELRTRLIPLCAELSPSGSLLALGCQSGNVRFVALEDASPGSLLVTAMQSIREESSLLGRFFGKTRTLGMSWPSSVRLTRSMRRRNRSLLPSSSRLNRSSRNFRRTCISASSGTMAMR